MQKYDAGDVYRMTRKLVYENMLATSTVLHLANVLIDSTTYRQC